MKKKDTLTLILTESQYYDPNMQDLIQNAESVEIITDEEFERMVEGIESGEEPLVN